ncbi:MAG: 4-(cytidine 5'-diphospho)-2-C-methyl-D-erythritol kinase [Lachnospiraceae bacterium]|nr:4-(cytidine 5'-diphospho)-2-C-methyl-D-erythritol kinase [Lachnospiraceae bacterium]
MDTLSLKAMAKINLGLDVVRRLPSGYHEVRMVMQTIGLYDMLSFTKVGSGITIETDQVSLPGDENNLIYKAARLFEETYGLPSGVSIRLEKRIPMAAGMAGGSTDAAATFVGLNTLFAKGISREELSGLSVKVGADVPYCIMGGTMLSEGIGEILTPLPAPPSCHVLIAKPDIDVSTKYVYENLHANELKHHPDMDAVIAAIRGGDLSGMCTSLENVLETVTGREYPVIGRIEEQMKACGAKAALMSGSGPTVFGLFERKEDAEKAKAALREDKLAKDLFVTAFTDKTCVPV